MIEYNMAQTPVNKNIVNHIRFRDWDQKAVRSCFFQKNPYIHKHHGAGEH